MKNSSLSGIHLALAVKSDTILLLKVLLLSMEWNGKACVCSTIHINNIIKNSALFFQIIKEDQK